jgi:type I restriction enzyme S subunit
MLDGSGNFQEAIRIRSGGAAIQNVASVKILKEIATPLPAAEVQSELLSRLDAVASETQKLEESYNSKLEGLAQLKHSILQKAFSGELTSPPSQAIKEAAE